MSLTATITQESKKGKKGQGGRKMEGRKEARKQARKENKNE